MTRRTALGLAVAAAALVAPPRPAAARPAGAARLVTLETSSPLVAFRLAFDAGSIDDPPGKQGLTALAATLVAQGGTPTLTYSQVLEALFPMAARIGVNVDKEVTVFTGEVHRDHLEAFWPLFAALLVTPRFDPADFARVRSDAENAISTGLRGSDDEELGKRTLQWRLYAAHPYAHPEVGTIEGLRHVALADVEGFWRTRFTLDRLTVGLAGGYPRGFPQRVLADLRALPAKGAKRGELPAAPRPSGRRVTIVAKEALADAISWGFPIDLTRRDDDFFALMVANSYLGEHRTFNGVLMNELREVRGLNYGDYSYVENFIQDGWTTFALPNIPRRQQYFSVWLRPVKPENAGFALRASLYHVEKLIRDGIPQDGFEATRAFLLGYSRLWAQTTSRRLGFALDSRWYGRRDFLAEIQERLPKLTKAEVDAAIRKHLRTEDLEIAIVSGRAAELARELGSGAPTPIHYDTEGTPARVLEEDRTIEAWPLRLSPAGVAVIPVGDLFER